MKKLKLFILLFLVFLCTGCFSSISNEKMVYNYLQQHSPGEKFDIQFYRNVELEASSGGCGIVPGHTWKVTSMDTGITFYVQDYYYFDSFTCKYRLDDNYFDMYLYNRIQALNDNRVKVDPNFSMIDYDKETGYGYLPSINSISLDFNSFTSENELAEVIVSVQRELSSDLSIKRNLLDTFCFEIHKDNEKTIYINFSSANSVYFVLEELHKNDTQD